MYAAAIKEIDSRSITFHVSSLLADGGARRELKKEKWLVTPTKVAVEVTLPYDEHEHHHEEAVILPPNGSLFPPIQSAVEVDQKHDPPYLQPVELNPPQDIQPNDGAVEAPPTTNNPPVVEAASPKPSAVVADRRPHQSLAAVEADSPPNDNQALVPEVAPRPPPKTAAKAAEFVTVADPLKCVNNPRPVLDELPLLPLPQGAPKLHQSRTAHFRLFTCPSN